MTSATAPHSRVDIQDVVGALSASPRLMQDLVGVAVEHKKFGTGKIAEVIHQAKAGYSIKVKYRSSGSVFSYSVEKFLSCMVCLILYDTRLQDKIQVALQQYRNQLQLRARRLEEQERLRSIQLEEQRKRAESEKIEKLKLQKAEFSRWVQDNRGYAFLTSQDFHPRLRAIVESHRSNLLRLKREYRGIRSSSNERNELGCWGCRDELDQAFGIKCNTCGWEICSKCATCGCGHPVYDPVQKEPSEDGASDFS